MTRVADIKNDKLLAAAAAAGGWRRHRRRDPGGVRARMKARGKEDRGGREEAEAAFIEGRRRRLRGTGRVISGSSLMSRAITDAAGHH